VVACVRACVGDGAWQAQSVPASASDHAQGPVTCDDSSEDDEAHGVYKVKLGADDVGDLGIALREISIASVDPEGLAQYRAHVTLRPGMVLRSINGVPVARLAYEAVCELTGLGDNNGSTDVRGLTMCFHRPG
jgi:hypothetical protein